MSYVAIFQMILFLMADPVHSGLAKTTQDVAFEAISTGARSTPINCKNGVSNLGRTLIGAKHAQRSRGGQARRPALSTVWATIGPTPAAAFVYKATTRRERELIHPRPVAAWHPGNAG
jgi:hypothetical protein